MTPQTIAGRPAAIQLAINGGTPVADPKVQIISVKLSERDIEAALAVLRSGMLAMGANCAKLEERFASETDATRALTCANGTCALQLAYEALIQPGDDVLVPAWGYIATVSMIVARGANPIFVDADPETYNFDPADAASKITPKTTAIVATHLYGNPVDINAIQTLASKHGLKVIYDAAQAHLARYNDRGIGAFGDCSTYSFYATKNMTTGEGGMVTTNDDAIAERIGLLRSHGETAKYTHGVIGYNYRMSDIEAALGLSQLDALPERTRRRQQIAASLTKAISAIPGLHPPVATSKGEHVYHLYQVRVDPQAFAAAADDKPGALRDQFCAALNAEGIATAVHYPRSVTRQPVFDAPDRKHPPVADQLAQTLFCVPVHHNLSAAQVEQIGQALAKVAAAMRA